MNEIETACRRARRVATRHLAVLRMGVIGVPAFAFLHAPLLAFKQKFPEFEVKLEEASSSTIAQQIADGILDCGLFLNSVTHPEIEQRVVAKDQLAFAVSTGHALACRSRLSFDHLRGEKVILFPRERNPHLYDSVINAIPDFKPNLLIEASSRNGAILLAAADMGVAVIAESMRRICPHSTKFLPLAGSIAGVDIVLGWKRGSLNPLEPFLTGSHPGT